MDKAPVISDKEIRYKLEEIQPEGFDWSIISDSEMVKFKAVAQTQLEADHTYYEAGIAEAVRAERERIKKLLDSQGLYGRFGICVNIEKWDKFRQTLLQKGSIR